jgi:hypothetical protein
MMGLDSMVVRLSIDTSVAFNSNGCINYPTSVFGECLGRGRDASKL